MSGFDVLTATNYGFLVEKPGSSTLLDLFGPCPVYIVVEIAGVWALMTWPWTRQASQHGAVRRVRPELGAE